MHKLNLIPSVSRDGAAVAALLLLLLGPVTATYALLPRADDGDDVREEFDEALGGAIQTYQFRNTAQATRNRRQEALREEEEELQGVMEEKTQVRKKIELLEDVIVALQDDYGAPANALTTTGVLLERHVAFTTGVRTAADAWNRDAPRDTVRHVLAGALRGTPAAATVHEPLKELSEARRNRQAFHALLVARSAEELLASLRSRHGELIASADTAQEGLEAAKKAVARSEAEIRQIQAIMRDVHSQVLRLQADMTRIDARLKARAERALIEKGLLPPRLRGGSGSGIAATPDIQWPVKGPISAGFMNADYKEYFGVPHYGIDIVVKENTPVRSAADGVVFLVRDGGETGYTYVLIGHSSGIATLYGHLRSVAVATGQDVNAGQVIGLSGGRPGTPGAGPLTTAPHLHFELIQNGSNIDPRILLP